MLPYHVTCVSLKTRYTICLCFIHPLMTCQRKLPISGRLQGPYNTALSAMTGIHFGVPYPLRLRTHGLQRKNPKLWIVPQARSLTSVLFPQLPPLNRALVVFTPRSSSPFHIVEGEPSQRLSKSLPFVSNAPLHSYYLPLPSGPSYRIV